MASPTLLPKSPAAAASPSSAAGGHIRPAEVETEMEDNEDEAEESPHDAEEVEEEDVDAEDDDDGDLPDDATERPNLTRGGSVSSTQSAERPVEVWKQFGCDTEAGRALRKLYGNIGQAKAAAQISYPKLKTAPRKPELAAPKPCPQRAAINVPKPGQRRALDPDDPRHWRVPAGGRKPAKEILAEIEASQPEKPVLVEGRDHGAEKQYLQDRFRYCGSNALPKGVMGHVPKGEMPQGKPRRAPEEQPDYFDEAAGMTVEQREIFVELVEAVKRKQSRLKEIDAENSAEDGAKPSKARTNRNKEALQLQNDIEELTADMDKLIRISEQ